MASHVLNTLFPNIIERWLRFDTARLSMAASAVPDVVGVVHDVV